MHRMAGFHDDSGSAGKALPTSLSTFPTIRFRIFICEISPDEQFPLVISEINYFSK
jgi:hypothetical protein